MHFTRKMVSGVLLAAVAGLTACGGEEAPMQESAQEGNEVTAALAAENAVKREANQQLARALAVSLKEPAMRGLVRAAMAESLVKEEKVHFNSYLRGPGRALLRHMSRSSGLSMERLEALLTQAGSLEFYLPVKEHRAAWRGGEELLVVSQQVDHETPVGFKLNGDTVMLSAEEAPATPALVLVSAEDFDAEGVPSKRGLALGRGGQALKEAMGDIVTAQSAWTGAYVNYVNIPHDFEAWPRGDPEFEMYLERVGTSRQKLRCTGAGSITPFRWNMDGSTWSTPFLIAWEGETPTLDGLGMYFYEDDDTECVVKDDKDFLKLTMDALKNSYSAYKAYQEKQWDQAVIHFYHAGVAFWSLIQGGDEYVGAVTSYNGMQIDGTNRTYSIKNDAQIDRGTVQIQWTTRYY